ARPTGGWLAVAVVVVHLTRLFVFWGSPLRTPLGFRFSRLAAGPALFPVFLITACGAPGLFPPYYSFSQELTVRHQGKVTGMLGCISWLSVALMQWLIGRTVRETGSYAAGLALAGVLPLVGLVALVFFWEKKKPDMSADNEKGS